MIMKIAVKKPAIKAADAKKPAAQRKMAAKTTSATQADSQTLAINDVECNLADLSESTCSQIINLRVTDQEIACFQQQLAIYQTARIAYARALA